MGTSLTDLHIPGAGLGTSTAHSRTSQHAFVVVLATSLVLSTRLAFAIFWLITSTYCLLAYVPFSYFGFIRDPLLTWIPLFTKFHALLYAVSVGAVAITLIPDLRKSRTRSSYAGFLLFNAIGCIYLWWHPVLATITPDIASYIGSLLALFPLIWLSALDLAATRDSAQAWEWPSATAALTMASLSALIVATGFGGTALLRTALADQRMPGSIVFRGMLASASSHLVIFLGVATALQIFRFLSHRTPWSRDVYLVFARAFAWLLCTLAIRNLIFPTISFEGTQANILAGVMAFAIVVSVVAMTAQLRSRFADWEIAAQSHLSWICLPLLLVLTAAYFVPSWIGRADWDSVLQKVATLAVWLFVFQTMARLDLSKHKKTALLVVLSCGFAAIGGYMYVRTRVDDAATQAIWYNALDTYAGADISYKTASSILSLSINNSAYGPFYDFLKQNSNLPQEVVVSPADTRLVARLQPSRSPKPNIFIFVIDSLRQDSIPPYNGAVNYTPTIARFAADSVVFRNAFTRYGGTALSEPAIWVGAMQLHKQYIEPFYPMNNLQQLVDTDGYQSYISFDPILQRILRPSPSIVELENDKTDWGNLDFVPTLGKLETAIDARQNPSKPIFAYSQPQNVHTLTLQRSHIPGGRREVTAFELRRIDKAFGEFLRFLQDRGLYENSIIILTSDHGDAYGEFGRYGHSDYLFPEVVRIPLIVHLPTAMRAGVVYDANKVSFNTDITPTLYYLLGHRPILNNELFGRPLFTNTLTEQEQYGQPYYLLVSSYAPVYAILSKNGQSLFIADAVNRKHYFYDLKDDPLGSRNHVDAHIINENQPLIRDQIERIDSFYGWHAPQTSP
ncbi:MAG TPA: sulfatase-like hydrolase/transferase [Terriglobales bacterium]|nr:sulfatase-like hydrolase/transferase [Terriglobales bacterium]